MELRAGKSASGAVADNLLCARGQSKQPPWASVAPSVDGECPVSCRTAAKMKGKEERARDVPRKGSLLITPHASDFGPFSRLSPAAPSGLGLLLRNIESKH